ncbi:SNARE-associated protein Snapin-like [Clavelina lepadiformis]|uniref:Biogenesis of lysosome-related organelles complex 1 subunit 7 n=1 Tax=Clavelina lepadiformis TaxID=159417 RepID=A0ABP0FAZ2_CLALP
MAKKDDISCNINSGLFEILKPAVEKIDDNVRSVQQSQRELQEKIDAVSAELQRIGEKQPATVNLEPYIKKLISTKRRVVLISNIVQNVQDRLTRLQKSAEAETLRKQAHVQAQNALIGVTQSLNVKKE